MKKRYLTAIIAVVLSVVMLFNFTACSENSNETADACPPHTYAEWVIDIQATCTAAGSRHHTCSKCGYTEEDDIAALGHNYVDGVCLRCASIDPDFKPVEIPVSEEAKIKLTANQPVVGQTVSAPTEVSVVSVNGYNASVEKSSDFGISSYKANSLEVTYDSNSDEFGVIDTVTVDDVISVEQSYYVVNDELALGEIYADYYEVEVDYTDDGKVEGVYYYDTYYIYKYDDEGRLYEVYKDGELYKSLTYNGNGNIISELTVAEEADISKAYIYTQDGALQSVDGKVVYEQYHKDGDAITVGNRAYTYLSDDKIIVNGDRDAELSYQYEFNGTKYITSKTIDGITTQYSYVGDRLVSLQNDSGSVEYILDNELSYIGLKYQNNKYYFAVDPYGNVMALIDSDGEAKVIYEHDIWGNLYSVTGEMADSLGKVNEIVNLNGIYDSELGVYYLAEGIYIPSYGITLQNDSQTVAQVKSMYEWEQNGYFARSAVSSFATIHDKVVDVVVENLKEQGMDVVSNLYATDKSGNSRRLVDIYTLDYSITPFSAMNLVDGNQIYEVIYRLPNSERYYKRAQQKLNDICTNWTVSYFAEYTPVAGTMDFYGQFIYMDKLISYQTESRVGGIVSYEVLTNTKANYDMSVNIFNYDTNRYVNYVDNTFDLDFLDGVTIIPGISRETYNKIDGFLADQLQSVAGNVCDQMLIYDDPEYYAALEANQAKDYWSQMNLGPDATTSYLEIQDDGSVQVKTMPVWETDGFVTKLLIGAGVILVTAVVATIAISIPGANCVVVSICVGAAKGAIGGALSGFAFGAIAGGAGELINQIASGQTVDWEKIANAAAGAAADGFMTGAITGAIMGGIQGGIKPTYCFEAGTPVVTENGAVAIEDITVGDRVLSYDYVTGEQSYQTVTATSIRQTNELIALSVCGEQIVTTPRHPFYMVNDDTYHGYTAAEYLSAGDCILTADGDYAVIESVEKQLLAEPIDVYNFTVENNHSYYVGETELLVHNAVGCGEKVYKKSTTKTTYNAGDKTPDGWEILESTAQKLNGKGNDVRVGGQLSMDTIDDILKNGTRYIDNTTGNINIFVKSDFNNSILRLTIPKDGTKKLISAGFVRPNQFANGIAGLNPRWVIFK